MNKKERKNIGLALFLSCIAAVVMYVWIYKSFPVHYAINDDMAMRDIAAGAMTGSPDGHLVFIKYVLGWGLSQMYLFLPGYDWYGVLMSGLVVLGFGLVLYRGLADIRSIQGKIIYGFLSVFIFLCIGVQHVVSFQWTVSAGIIGAAAVFFFYTSPEEEKLRNHVEEIVAALLLILTFCIRQSVFMMILPAAGICYLYKYVKIEKNKKIFLKIKHIWFWPLILFSCGLVLFAETKAYEDSEWKSYLDYNTYRSEIYDYYGIPSYKENKEFYDSIDMDKGEVALLQDYSITLIDEIKEYKMEAVANYAENTLTDGRSFLQRLIQGLQNVYADFESGEYAPLCWILTGTVLITVWVCHSQKSKELYLLLICGGIQIFLWSYLGFEGRIVSRVSFSMHIYFFMITAGILFRRMKSGGTEQKFAGDSKRRLLLTGTAVFFTILSLFELTEVRTNAEKACEKNQKFEQICDYIKAHPENIYTFHVSSVSEYGEKFRIRRNFEVLNAIYLGGWQSFSPNETARRHYLGVENLKKSIYKKDNVMVLSRVNTEYMREYFEEEYGTCHAQLLDTIGFSDDIYMIENFGE